MPDSRFDSNTDNILFFGDPNLGGDGFRLFSGFFPNAKQLIWKKGTDKTVLRKKLRSRSWLFTISFYNDFIFSYDDFDFLGLPLNIHPALPVLRGVGYDHVPLIENHGEHGATLHFMNRSSRLKVDIESDVDSGRIIRVRKCALSPEATYGDLRLLNQHVALDMLAGLCKQMLVWGCVETARRELCAEAETNGFAWSRRYISSSILGKMLEELYMFDPGHRVFVEKPRLVCPVGD
ncbi:hypothetical protein OO006_11000 [Prosthecochloris sp. SCSIO W1101]|uniref:hypothetical protein n=1 Tax=Prosthecochloris sp. SCSIO W1101 TaxID=2992242 RepID=UPI00223E738A|nr:hypothetical protein [Prosthecochloris sp. SCSIO W1101]UZJ40872.1 hypothetical protein OO006_11000 [Prosthecochloris sp. SCSIO W1101]